ncbi:MAG: DNA polymerase III subunit delta' [Anaerolineae bacterium]|nr:DNA polymerase III subunit delta' [Anaerolineae bacterium]
MWTTIGHRWAVQFLQRAIATEHIAHTYLFVGPAHIGKTHLALEMAAALNCTGQDPPCGTCQACIKTRQRIHPDVILVEPEGDHLKIAQVRQLQYELSLSPHEGRRRICIITDFQTATVEAANALLKTLEEPPARVVIILTATDTHLLLPTIVSRCQIVPLWAVPAEEIARALVERWQERPERARLIARLSAGRVGWAIQAIQEPTLLADRQERVETFFHLLAARQAERMRLAEKESQQEKLAESIRLWQGVWRDLLLLQKGCEELTVNSDFTKPLQELASKLPSTVVEEAIRATERALQQLAQNANPRLVMEVLFLGWPHAKP